MIGEREIAVMRWLGEPGRRQRALERRGRSVPRRRALADRLAALDAEGLVDVLDPFGTEKRVVLDQRGVAYLIAHPVPCAARRAAGAGRGP